jgi:hypothetical protein
MSQAIDFRFELLFLMFALFSAIALITAVVLTLRGRGSAARKLLTILGFAWVGYLSVVFVVAAVTPQRSVPIDKDLCFDEMCFAVVKVQTAKELGPVQHPVPANGIFYVITVSASNRARGRAQSEKDLHALLWSRSRTYGISSIGQGAWEATHPQTASLTSRVVAGKSSYSDHVFDVARQETDLGLVLRNGFTPGYFVIGECPLFHKPTILRLSRD